MAILILALIFILFFWPKTLFQITNTSSLTMAGNLFGGKTKEVIPCLHPFTGFYIKLSGPTAGDFIYNSGTSKSYLYGPPNPNRLGQWLLGYAAGDVKCFTAEKHGKWRNPKSGTLILFHGSSM
ncbi:MAG: hypothetical protein A3I88_01855 [Candidatus Portnoybacteria bacterium RIFCSPLOWO2_12_FULL_39_9]|uniref:Uncharacterized protein n=1 Tax=Candidatus Portnoybacteria bacterium RIFCSPHIGHO2_12_FULL_38_9 TaxID=1801997 RepID=A0A1G2FHA6_9BACT|nr:MAG: hypothetical protein A3H00_03100 [Candidatus Portnoybacteria bacterium RBG_13_40_8]OGZ36559.1 MAG: hypothetical protein A2646_00035 [Candidatus Portnoybacteria bacterium RIFCSPHIGHO2_02_FULL_39_12]OGZ37453.1 MAG: hypothetical protein A3J64_00460 [Candidatus Portnoybacteria bacterium RIFCSPHIGHO2_12_FULL_38_9]OGZ39099.1 MAG: hypothetical protein A3F21_00035 [Candidatus Portnoybacteria bacterium RIFCSPLOWO2_01_FULL_38_39]OGZ40189.1 MAG: hypothetical protein A3I88_01855 [Candidatus Portnoy